MLYCKFVMSYAVITPGGRPGASRRLNKTKTTSKTLSAVTHHQ